jgi:probable rRNA maturation factor
MSDLILRNRQRRRRVNARLLKQIVRALLAELEVSEAELGIHLVAAPEMARLNRRFLKHEGSTDVITFDLRDMADISPSPVRRERAGVRVHGEIFICLDDAVAQARQFQTTWQAEVARYLVHGVLHLLGHDDLKPAARRRMKREENRLLRRLGKEFPLTRLAR